MMAGSMWCSKTAHFKVAGNERKRKRERGTNMKVYPSRACAILLQVESNGINCSWTETSKTEPK
jgi:acyl-homoserine lactone acylase PvdQ